MNWKEHITSEAGILSGKPAIKGTRISVELILELFAKGWTEEQVLESYPNLSTTSLRAVFSYLHDCIRTNFTFPSLHNNVAR